MSVYSLLNEEYNDTDSAKRLGVYCVFERPAGLLQKNKEYSNQLEPRAPDKLLI